jgi:hypothetical protein
MIRLKHRRGNLLVALTVAILAGALGMLGGCSSGPKIRIEANAPFTEPPVRFESSGWTHIAVFTAPTSGWRIELDVSRRAFRVQQVFVTLRSPAPGAPTAQVLSDHAVDTGVETSHNVAVFARIVTGRDAPGDMPYRLAGEVTPNPPAH